ncbi:MAG: glutamate synthase subunit beta [Burkholderiales bacterium]|nr:glutamate synthase subunit beta [Burkholderiales bacterium]
MGKPTGFMEYQRLEQKHEPVEVRLTHFNEFISPLESEEARQQAARCMDCGTPFCTFSCPLHNIAPEFNDYIYNGDWETAYEVLSSTNNFPEFTSRICPALCENGCILNYTATAMGVKSVERAIITHAWNKGWVKPKISRDRKEKSIAIVGSGPSGLACAQQLARKGYAVTVFEKNSRPGGLLRFGIPDFKLDKAVLDRRIDQLKAEGVKFECNTNVAVEEHPSGIWSDAEKLVSADDLKKNFDAVVLTIGSEEPRDLKVPGRNLNGVCFAMEYLPRQNRINADLPIEGEISAKDKKVLIIGGGDTGSDCLGTALRQGAKSVLQIDLGPKPPETYNKVKVWPQWPKSLRTSTSQEEGGERDWAISSKEFVDDGQGNVCGVKAVRLKWNPDPLTGRIKFEEIKGSDFTIDADLVILAMGFAHPNNKVLDAFGVEKDGRGNAKANYDTGNNFATSVPGVFAAGDCRRGQSLVVWALSEGRRCAETVDEYLESTKEK